MELSAFEQEFIRRLRALPFGVQQHVSRFVLRLYRQHSRLVGDDEPRSEPDDDGLPPWTMTGDEIDRLLAELKRRDAGNP